MSSKQKGFVGTVFFLIFGIFISNLADSPELETATHIQQEVPIKNTSKSVTDRLSTSSENFELSTTTATSAKSVRENISTIEISSAETISQTATSAKLPDKPSIEQEKPEPEQRESSEDSIDSAQTNTEIIPLADLSKEKTVEEEEEEEEELIPDEKSISSGKYYTSSHPRAKYYYPEDCSDWKGLSQKYLKSFNSLEELQKNYSRTLSPQCD